MFLYIRTYTSKGESWTPGGGRKTDSDAADDWQPGGDDMCMGVTGVGCGQGEVRRGVGSRSVGFAVWCPVRAMRACGRRKGLWVAGVGVGGWELIPSESKLRPQRRPR